jgi:hypothetical protein
VFASDEVGESGGLPVRVQWIRQTAGSEYPMNTTQIRYQRRRLADMTAALRLARAQMSHEHGPRAELVRHQQQRLEVVVRHAAANSPYYRREFAKSSTLTDGQSS